MPRIPADQCSPYPDKNRSAKHQSQSPAETTSHQQRHGDRGSPDDEPDGDIPPEAERTTVVPPMVPLGAPGSFTIPEFLERYKICRAKFYGEVRSGRLKLMKVGSRSLISFHSALAWERACETGA
jgi:hypothetical protein